MKKRNSGFTLVELVIAIVILAIAVSPLLANFIQSSKMNLKSRKQLNALNLAQDIMEGMSQYTAEENATYLFSACVSDNSILEDKRVLPVGTTVNGCTGSVVTKTDYEANHNASSNPVATPFPTDDWAKFTFDLNGVQTTTGNYNSYDLRVSIDSTQVSTNIDNGSLTPQEVAEAVNGKDYAAITNVDQYFDVIHTISESEEELAYSALRDKSNSPAITLSSYKGKVSREIAIDIVDNGTLGNPDYSVNVASTYKVLDTYKAALGFTGSHADEASTTHINRTANLSKAESNVMPRSVYLYFEGLSGASSVNRENIVINNTTNQPITVYLVRTVDPATLTQQSVIDFNLLYACDVYIHAKDSALPGAADVETVDVVSNLRYNLLSDTPVNVVDGDGNVVGKIFNTNFRITEEDGVTLLPGIDNTNKNYSTYIRPRSFIYYNDDANKIDEDMYQAHINDGYKKAQKDVLYDVKIEIREHGKSNTIATYTGGLSN